MADFRRWLFALAVVALLAGFSVPVRAQQGPAFNCQATVGVPPIIRAEGLTELVGDVTLDCTGGISTPAGKAVPPVDITVFLSQNVTSKITASVGGVNFDEALMIVDEPHSGAHPAIPLLNCGNTLAPDTGNSGPGVCGIISDGVPTDTYNGTGGVYTTGTGTTLPCDGAAETVDPAASTYACGHPNVFQGRQGSSFFAAGFPNTSVTFAGVPIDPPGSVGHRIIRITNIRVNATAQGFGSSAPSPITLTISINGNTSMGINNPLQTVAYVQPGLGCPEYGTNCTSGNGASFLQCEPPGIASTNVSLTFQEGFLSSWKARNISFITDQGDLTGAANGNGQLQAGGSYWSWAGTFNTPADVNQNVPGAIYFTESGFMYPSGTGAPHDPNPNPPNGVGTIPVTATTYAFANAYNGSSNSTNISAVGTVSQGTRLIMQLGTVPTNTSVFVPGRITITNTAGKNSGALVLINSSTNPPNANGYGGAFDSVSGNVQVFSNTVIVYEVVFADPFSLETATVPFFVSYNNNPSTLAQTGVPAVVSSSGFAPTYSSGGTTASTAPSPFPIPRFIPHPNSNYPNGIVLYEINKCTCNILFPFVTSGAPPNSGQVPFDTGIAIVNTSKDPGAAAFGTGNGAGQQTGTVTLWMYGSNFAGLDASLLPAQTTTAPIPAGQALLYDFAEGGGQIGGGVGSNAVSAGLNAQWMGYTGYVIAQAQFQYCHAYAFISQIGLAQGVSEGYLGLVLDNNGVNCNGEPQGTPGINNLGLCRTNQEGENLVH